jgi:catechol-2,3-dioxygenase
VLFAKRLDEVAAFYSKVLELDEAGRDDNHILLKSPGFQMVCTGS